MEHRNTTVTSSSTTMETLQGLNDKLARLDMGALIFVSAMMGIGFVGNLHVLIFYALRMKSTNHRNFILFLSSLDMTSCIVGMPLTIYTLKEPLFYATSAMCKLHLFVNYFICIASAFTLLVIAFERYRKICKPFGWQLSRKYANLACLLVLITALVCSVPVLVMIESKRIKNTDFPWISAELCVKVDKNATIHYKISLVIIVIVILLVLTVLYKLVWKVTTSWTLSKIHTTQSNEVKNDKVNELCTSTFNTADSFEHIANETEIKSSHRQISKSRKLTLAFSLITAVFFVSYIPYLALHIIFGAIDNVPNFSESEYIVINMAFYCVYISNTTNCFIYGFTNTKFRHEVKETYIRLFCCNTFQH